MRFHFCEIRQRYLTDAPYNELSCSQFSADFPSQFVNSLEATLTNNYPAIHVGDATSHSSCECVQV